MNLWTISPAVFAVGKTYQIMLPVDYEAIMWVKIGDKTYYDSMNGIMRSRTRIHRVCVPMEELNLVKAYTVFVQKIISRKPYFTETEKPEEKIFIFKPIEGRNVKAYHIADMHGEIEAAVKAAKAYGEMGFLILNGDIPNDSGDENHLMTVYHLVSQITHGNIPVVFARGNHDMRGRYAERFVEYMPCQNGFSYYTFRLGGIWGMILDCGEDKEDEHPEFGNMVCCHDFREKETEYIEQVIRNARIEYEAEDVTHKIIISHMPFTRAFEDEYSIEKDIYFKWVELLREHVKPQIILCGHEHKLAIYECGSEMDAYGQPCPVVIGSEIMKKDGKITHFAGAGVFFSQEGIEISF